MISAQSVSYPACAVDRYCKTPWIFHKSIACKTRKKKLGMAEHVCNPSTWEVKAEKSRVKGYPQLHSKLGANLGYMRPCLKTKTEQLYIRLRDGKEKAEGSSASGTQGPYGKQVQGPPQMFPS